MTTRESMKQNIKSIATERGYFVVNDDGYYVYWPPTNTGYSTAAELRLVAEILDEMNEAWDAEVRAAISGPTSMS